MNNTLKDYIEGQKVCVLTTLISDGGPHSAAMYYSFDRKNEKFYFVADINDMKCENISEESPVFSSMVIGVDDEKWKTLQVRGGLRLVPVDEEEFIIKTVLSSLTEIDSYINNKDRAIMELSPDWWKFTDAGNGSITFSN